ncbi:hypothetical protein ABBQ38_008814 [Trebouxia sp. C0009 RCD-2024]
MKHQVQPQATLSIPWQVLGGAATCPDFLGPSRTPAHSAVLVRASAQADATR